MTKRVAMAGLAVTGALLVVTGPADAAFPGANGKIVYLEEDGDAEVLTLVAQSPRSGARTVLRRSTSPPACFTSSATYSPDGAKLASQACGRLATMNADGSGLVQLPLFSKPDGSSGLYYAEDAGPAWSPDGERIVFTSVSGYDDGFDPYETDRLAIVASNGSSPRFLGDAEGAGAQWSTRGLIAYAKGGPVPAIYTIRPNGSGKRLLLRRATQPEWAPDGRSIAFVRGHWRSPHFRYIDPDIYVARANGKGVRRLVRGLYPAWSPNGKRLAFVQGKVRAGSVIWSLYTIRLDGTHRRLLARTDDEIVAPDWQPLP